MISRVSPWLLLLQVVGVMTTLPVAFSFLASHQQLAPCHRHSYCHPSVSFFSRSQPPPPSIVLLHATNKKKGKTRTNIIAINRNARRNYEILETLEAGVSLLGTEVKSIRDGKMNLRDGYIKPTKDGRSCVLCNVHIGKHAMSAEYFQHEERRERRLLVHKSEARKLLQQTEGSGMTIVPLKAYFSDDNKVKLEIALCRGKNVRDKRADIKEREAKRDERRIIKSFRVA
jgi:SsrA-binding protein